jgi:hypothetical protein
MSKDPFGLGVIDESPAPAPKANPLADLSDFRPTKTIADLSEPERRRIDQVAGRSGFSSREPVEIRRRSRMPVVTQALHTRLRVQDYNRLVAFCEKHDVAYAEGVQMLLDHAKVDDIGNSALDAS